MISFCLNEISSLSSYWSAQKRPFVIVLFIRFQVRGMTLHLLVYLNVTEPFGGFCPISNGTYPVNQTCKNISGLHVLLDYPLKGPFSQISALSVSVHFKSCNNDGKKEKKNHKTKQHNRKNLALANFTNRSLTPKCQTARARAQTRLCTLSSLQLLCSLHGLTVHSSAPTTHTLTSGNFHKPPDPVNSSLHRLFAAACLSGHHELSSPCTKCTLPTAPSQLPRQLPS